MNARALGFAIMAAATTAAMLPRPLHAQWSGRVGVESRLFPSAPADSRQRQHGASVTFQPEWSRRWDRGRQLIRFEPFVRVDVQDGARTHLDVRELSWIRAWDEVELTVGIAKVFGGVTESQHLVDVINQTDLVEDVDGEEKLGQPMVRLSWMRRWGTVDVFVLPGFRERTFPGTRGRLRFPIPVADDATYDSGARRRHVDWAVRYVQTFGAWDVGLSHFAGTSREPRFVPGGSSAEPVLTPHYDLVHQTGLDVQWTTGGWLWKFEGIVRSGQGETFAAMTGGFEYTFVGVFGTAVDVGLLAEYLRDERTTAPTPFDDDVFVGTRLALNDVQSTDVLAGAIVDRRTGSAFVTVEGNRRIGDAWTISTRVRAFAGVDRVDPLYGLRRDHHVRVTVNRHF